MTNNCVITVLLFGAFMFVAGTFAGLSQVDRVVAERIDTAKRLAVQEVLDLQAEAKDVVDAAQAKVDKLRADRSAIEEKTRALKLQIIEKIQNLPLKRNIL